MARLVAVGYRGGDGGFDLASLELGGEARGAPVGDPAPPVNSASHLSAS